MRLLPILAVVTIAAAPASAASVAPADAAALTGLFRSIYATYAPGDRGDWRALGEAKLFSPATLALIRTNRRLLHGEQGVPGYDVFCLCQDFDAITFRGATFGTASVPGLVTATVTTGFTINGRQTPKSYRFTMQRGPAGWRVHDITLSDGTSYRAGLIAENRQLAPSKVGLAPPAAPMKKSVIIANDVALAAKSVGLTVRGGKLLNPCGSVVEPPARDDLNRDGTPELVFTDGLSSPHRVVRFVS